MRYAKTLYRCDMSSEGRGELVTFETWQLELVGPTTLPNEQVRLLVARLDAHLQSELEALRSRGLLGAQLVINLSK